MGRRTAVGALGSTRQTHITNAYLSVLSASWPSRAIRRGHVGGWLLDARGLRHHPPSECKTGMLKKLRNSFKRASYRQPADPPKAEEISLNDRGLVGKEEPLLSASGGSPEGEDVLYVQEAVVIGIQNSERSNRRRRRYLFDVQLTWSNSAISHSCKSYAELFEFHCALLDMFPKEAGQVPQSARSIPYLPGLGTPIHPATDRGELTGTIAGC